MTVSLDLCANFWTRSIFQIGSRLFVVASLISHFFNLHSCSQVKNKIDEKFQYCEMRYAILGLQVRLAAWKSVEPSNLSLLINFDRFLLKLQPEGNIRLHSSPLRTCVQDTRNNSHRWAINRCKMAVIRPRRGNPTSKKSNFEFSLLGIIFLFYPCLQILQFRVH